jgi:hypothetical protein
MLISLINFFYVFFRFQIKKKNKIMAGAFHISEITGLSVPTTQQQQPPVRNWRKYIDAAISQQSQIYDEQAGLVVDRLFEAFQEKTRRGNAVGNKKIVGWPVVISLWLIIEDNRGVVIDSSSRAFANFCPELRAMVMQKLRAELRPQEVDVMDRVDTASSTVSKTSSWEFTFSDAKKPGRRPSLDEGLSRCEDH